MLQPAAVSAEPQEDPDVVASGYWRAIEQALQSEQPGIPTMGCNLHWIANHCAIESQVRPVAAPLHYVPVRLDVARSQVWVAPDRD